MQVVDNPTERSQDFGEPRLYGKGLEGFHESPSYTVESLG
jgi:hypothetical protein